MTSRLPIRISRGVPTSDGAGVRLTRLMGGDPRMPSVDPFLMLDYFDSPNASDYLAGFPPHPHRGFETVTYMLNGRMRHQDNHGHEGVIETGGVQWMTAGRGIVHSEMPEQTSGLMRGFQLWVNLPAKLKMQAPAYQEHPAASMPVEARDGGVEVLSLIHISEPTSQR
ncbi:MAG: pirin family protein, partial [Candidatus Eisenbacteria bacterium]|nr:pirin family protein [Candidatus Eisenbacteria bacterium]